MVSRRQCLCAGLAAATGASIGAMAQPSALATRGQRTAGCLGEDFDRSGWGGSDSAHPASGSPPGFIGSFIQLWRRHHQWHALEWDSLFDAFKALGLQILVVQWTRVDALRFDRPLREPGLSEVASPLEAILSRARQRNLKIMVGLDHEASWWTCARLDAPALEAYLARRALGSLALARALVPRLQTEPSFAGWYLSEEIDAVSFASHRARSLLRRFLLQLSEGLRRLMPGTRVGVSAFAPAGLQPEGCAQLWSELVHGGAPVDRLLLQDGVGVGSHTLDQWMQRLNLVRQAVMAARAPDGAAIELWPVVETFTQTAGPGGSASGFAAQPTQVDRLVQQLRVAAQGGPAIAFSVPDYLAPQAGSGALALYQDYLRAGLTPAVCSVTGVGPAGGIGPAGGCARAGGGR